jgi:hypothetical protein
VSIAADIVGRLHVGTGNREVIRVLRSKISVEHRTGRHKRSARHSFYRQGLEAHANNRIFFDELYGAGSSGIEQEITDHFFGGNRDKA